VFDQIRIPIIREAGGKLVEDPDPFLDLAQEQTPPSLVIAPPSNCARTSRRFWG